MKLPGRYLIPAILVFLLSSIRVEAQTAGNNTYEFLNLPASARVAAMGSNFLSVRDNDLNVAANNPSMISPGMHNKLALNFTDYFTGIDYGMVSYGRHFEKFGSMTAGVQFINYGQFTMADDQGVQSGQFTGGEYAFNLGWGRLLDSVFSIGANVRFIYSGLESYTSLGIATDVAASYIPSDKTSYSLVFRNIGRQITSYNSAGTEPVPFEIMAGLSQRLAHLPFRYSVVLQHMEKWDLTYNQEAETDPFTGQVVSNDGMSGFVDKAVRHVVVGGEFIPSKFFSLRLGYNYGRRQEMKVASRLGTVGFSWGFGLKINRFSFDYARAAYHLVGSPNYLSVSMALGKQ